MKAAAKPISAATSRRSDAQRTKNRLATWIALGYLAPNLLGFLVFTAGPVLFSFGASLTNWNLQSSPPLEFVGLRNFVAIAQSGQFWTFFANTVYFMAFIPVSIAGSLGVALLLDSRLKWMGTYRALLYLPSFTAGVAIMIMWKGLYNPNYGLINTTLRHGFDFVGIKADLPQWLLSTSNLMGLDPERLRFASQFFGIGAREALLFMGFWGALGGGNTLLYLAGLSNMPEELVEAAQLDGANSWQVFRHVKWPELAPTTFFIVVMSVIGGFQGGVESAQVMTGGGPAGTTTTLAFHIFQKSFVEYQFGYASAIAWFLFVFIFAFSAVLWKFGSKESSFA